MLPALIFAMVLGQSAAIEMPAPKSPDNSVPAPPAPAGCAGHCKAMLERCIDRCRSAKGNHSEKMCQRGCATMSESCSEQCPAVLEGAPAKRSSRSASRQAEEAKAGAAKP